MATIKRPWYFRYLFGALRKIWRWSPDRRKALNDAKDGTKFRCVGCSRSFIKENIAVDHINPVIDSRVGFTGWDRYVERLFCGSNGLQIMCKPCHKTKTAEENKTRKRAREERKKAA